MRFKGIHRRHRETRDVSYAPSSSDSRQRVRWRPERFRLRPRGDHPRDRLGRFRRVRRDEARDPGPDAVPYGVADVVPDVARDRPGHWTGGAGPDGPPRYSWKDFELDDAPPPRAEPRPPGSPYVADGRRHCGVLESILYRQWDARLGPPPPEVVRAVDSLAALPDTLKVKLAGGLEGIYVGPGGVPQLDDMAHLRDRPLPSGRGTWDICAGAYGDGKIIVGDRPSPTPDVMMHEVGHALDDIDGGDGWRSDSEEFRRLYERCLPHLAAEFHRQPDALGRREFFADAFAAISARQRPALVDMLAGNIRMALDVMLFFNRRYGI
ncbi:hypothetical protein Acsp03_38850 [Actinomadura sp. NBRC 104412]|uniref:hypothetical protein n=1 Tax=Actinomadura sp. NBRC 104412 TaxID=3032203 RepID=UPI0024A5D137|nr:hypothetical protein [Actinomadura sp. NBRC 104412]GLZ06419.1 hypothetical protein Acsp03_38850 [Actinomadura sp. NBRC 104412]